VDDVRVEPDEFIDGGDGRVIVPDRIVVRGHDSGIEVAQSIVQVWTMRNGLAVRMEAFPDLDAALASGAGPAQ
jgi:ketosteroid isomerase-like protein